MKSFISAVTVLLTTAALTQVHAQSDNLKLNQLQVIGSHNSYKTAIEPELYKALYAKDSAMPEYSMNILQLQTSLQWDFAIWKLIFMPIQ